MRVDGGTTHVAEKPLAAFTDRTIARVLDNPTSRRYLQDGMNMAKLLVMPWGMETTLDRLCQCGLEYLTHCGYTWHYHRASVYGCRVYT